MKNIFLFSQNLKLDSLMTFSYLAEQGEYNIFITSHKLFDYEKAEIEAHYKNCSFVYFAELLDDEELEECDHLAYNKKQKNVFEYWEDVKELKNKKIISKIMQRYQDFNGYILSDDLGIYENLWLKVGFNRLYGKYYFAKKSDSDKNGIKKRLKRCKGLYRQYRRAINYINEIKSGNEVSDDVYVSEFKGRKVIFIGRMSRIGYRLNLDFVQSEFEKKKIQKGEFYNSDEAEYISTLHESGKCQIPDSAMYDVKYIQDGYLPANYSNYYLKFKPHNVGYYAWDIMGEMLFINHDLPVEILPYRKKLFLPSPIFNQNIKKVLIATSGSGDWTALKNRSDDDILLETFIEVAKRFPDIEFIYRCHPTWVHPEHVGVHSIERASQCVEKCGVKNIKISSNIPTETLDHFVLSISRSSLEDDMKDCDIVFGEHSVSMIDAGFVRIPFCAVNITKRRSLFQSMVDLGFPECKNVDEIVGFIDMYNENEFQKRYNQAVSNYNEMTDKK